MISGNDSVAGAGSSTPASARVGLYSSILTAVTTLVTFGLAITAVPNAGAGCLENCVEYPYLDTLAEFPRDYLWMPAAMVLLVLYVVLVSSIHAQAVPKKAVYGQIGLSFALIAAGVFALGTIGGVPGSGMFEWGTRLTCTVMLVFMLLRVRLYPQNPPSTHSGK